MGRPPKKIIYSDFYEIIFVSIGHRGYCCLGSEFVPEPKPPRRRTTAFLMNPATDHAPPSTLLTHASLLSRLRDGGDAQAWEQFAERYGRLIRDFARHAGVSEHETRDIAQEVMLGFARQAAEFQYDRSKGRFKTWLLTLARRRIADHWRSRQRRLTREAAHLVEDTPPTETDLDRLWEQEWQHFLMDQALERVRSRTSNRQFLIWDLAVRQGMAASEICRTLDTHAAAVYLARHRVSQLVKQELRALATEEIG
jgi:RNA polymerase sigma factor (sigma-70 family)